MGSGVLACLNAQLARLIKKRDKIIPDFREKSGSWPTRLLGFKIEFKIDRMERTRGEAEAGGACHPSPHFHA